MPPHIGSATFAWWTSEGWFASSTSAGLDYCTRLWKVTHPPTSVAFGLLVYAFFSPMSRSDCLCPLPIKFEFKKLSPLIGCGLRLSELLSLYALNTYYSNLQVMETASKLWSLLHYGNLEFKHVTKLGTCSVSVCIVCVMIRLRLRYFFEDLGVFPCILGHM